MLEPHFLYCWVNYLRFLHVPTMVLVLPFRDLTLFVTLGIALNNKTKQGFEHFRAICVCKLLTVRCGISWKKYQKYVTSSK